jgi:BirA family biotin operon repressor/biotin-[acetyl-CoA-carboxylase] ligase
MNALDVELLRVLRGAALHLPGADLAAQLRVPLTTIEARIAELRAAGFEIEQHPGLGYRLVAAADRLVADDLLARLGPCPLIREITVFEETDSTNERAAQLARSGVAPGVAIFAERQTAGRGRFGRRWESRGHRGLWFSLLLRPDLPVEKWARLTTWAAVSVAEAIERALGLEIGIKWPNDLQIHGRKIAGILTETVFEPGAQPCAVVGIGVNVNHEPADFPTELADTAGSLRIASGRAVDRSALAVEILRALDVRCSALRSAFPELVEEAARRSVLMGKWIALRAGTALVEGTASGLDGEGQLRLRTASGELLTLSAGEVQSGADFPSASSRIADGKSASLSP